MYSKALGERVACGTKARVMSGRLLKDNVFWELLNADNLTDIATRLHEMEGYKPYLENIFSKEIRRRNLEPVLKVIPLEETAKFRSYLTGTRKAFLCTWLDRYEADNIKAVIRWQLSGKKERDTFRGRLLDIPGSSVPYDVLMSARDTVEFLESLKESPFYDVLKDPLENVIAGGPANPFPAEIALDIYSLTRLYRTTLELDAYDRKNLLPLVGSIVDITNLYWVYRGRRYFDMAPEELMNRLLPCHYKISLAYLKEMARAASIEELYSLMCAAPFYGAGLPQKLPDDELMLECALQRCYLMAARRILAKGEPSFHTAAAYLFLRELEIIDIITIIEDVRYDYDRRKAAIYLIRPLLSITGGDMPWQ